MRLYRRDAFLSLPAGAVYCKGQPWYFGGIQIKGETILGYEGEAIDWYYLDPQGIASFSSGEQVERLEAMLATGAAYPMDDVSQRDGFFDPDDLFLVYEPEDLRALIALLVPDSPNAPGALPAPP